jgi:putative membrane fusion protein
LCTIAFLLAVVAYIGYQVIANLTQQIRTVDALEVTVEEKLSARGYFIREQIPVSGGSGTAEYLVEDGAKVAKNQRVAVLFDGAEAHRAYDEAYQLEERLAAVQYAYSMITSGVDSLKMDQLIFKDILSINENLEKGEAWRVSGDYSALQQLVVSRGATEADKEAFEQQIKQLEGEIANAKKQYASGSSNIRAADSGYFVSRLDGYETLLTVDCIDSLTPDDLTALQPAQTDGVGSLTTGFRWYYAVVLTEEQADKLQQRKSLEVYFPELSTQSLEMQVNRLETVGEQSILVLESTRMDPLFLTAREQDIDIVVGRHSGLKVPSQALRQQEGEWGVFVLDGSVAVFKPITWNYSTESYFLVPCAASSKEGLFRYDRVIVQGRNLAENKVVQ